VSFIAYGKTFSEAIENSGAAIINIMFDVKNIKKTNGKINEIKINASGSSFEELTWKILQKIVSKIDEKGLQASEFKTTNFKKIKTKMYIFGSLSFKKTSKYMSLLDVKAVTPHNLKVKKLNGTWSIHILLDV
jgi:SHS2 domain-containing protein